MGALDYFVEPLRAIDSTMLARMNVVPTRGEQEPRLPLTLHVGATWIVRGDTTYFVGRQQLRVLLECVDTLSLRRSL